MMNKILSPIALVVNLRYIMTRGDNMATEKTRYSISLDDDMFQDIEDFRFENRYANRNQATIELIRLGLETIKREQKKVRKNKPAQKSKSYK